MALDSGMLTRRRFLHRPRQVGLLTHGTPDSPRAISYSPGFSCLRNAKSGSDERDRSFANYGGKGRSREGEERPGRSGPGRPGGLVSRGERPVPPSAPVSFMHTAGSGRSG